MNNSSPRIFKRLLGACTLLCAILALSPAQAADEPNNPDLGKPFASVTHLKGEVFVSNPQGTQRPLKKGATINVGDTVKAAPNGEAVLKTSDAGMLAVRPGTEFTPERYAAEGKPSDRQILKLLTGSLRIISGWIAQTNRAEHKVVTPSATIGIRGTDHEPYVLPPEKASEQYVQGTYDKVNRGGTTLDANGGSVDIDPGKVGFARDPKAGKRTRALFTILLPVLLDKVPDFYVPGSFDAELDRYAETQEKQAPKVPLAKAADTKAAAAVASAGSSPAITGCQPQAIGEQWLKRFDSAIVNRDVKSILALFAPDVTASATVRTQDGGTSTIDFKREEMVQSTLSAIASLKDYEQRRMSIQAKAGSNDCKQIDVTSTVIESGKMNDKPYRFEATEEYRLEQRNGEWLAVRAMTTQR